MKILVSPDLQKSNSLIKMAKISLERLKNTDMERYPTNTLTDYYDIIHKLLEALSLKEGVKFKGEGAHQELIDFISKKYLDEKSRLFLQDLREYRNRISYEGFEVNKTFIISNKNFIESVIEKLFKLKYSLLE